MSASDELSSVPETQVLYDDGLITLYKHKIVLHRYYFPFANKKTIPIKDLESMSIFKMSLLSMNYKTVKKKKN